MNAFLTIGVTALVVWHVVNTNIPEVMHKLCKTRRQWPELTMKQKLQHLGGCAWNSVVVSAVVIFYGQHLVEAAQAVI